MQNENIIPVNDIRDFGQYSKYCVKISVKTGEYLWALPVFVVPNNSCNDDEYSDEGDIYVYYGGKYYFCGAVATPR